MNVDVYTADNLPSPDSVGKGGVVYDGSRLRVSDGDAWIEDVTVLDDLTVTGDATVGGDLIGQRVVINTELLAASVDKWVFVADRAYQVVSIEEVHSVVGGASAAVAPRKVTAAGTAAPGDAAGATVKELTTAAIDLEETINVVQTATLSATAADLLLADGDKIGLNFSGTLTGLVGSLTIVLETV